MTSTLYIETVTRPLPPNAPPNAQPGQQAMIGSQKPDNEKPVRTLPFSGAMTPAEYTKRVNSALALATADTGCVVELVFTA